MRLSHKTKVLSELEKQLRDVSGMGKRHGRMPGAVQREARRISRKMRSLLTVGLGLSLAVSTMLSATAGTPAPAPKVTSGGGLFVESAEGASSKLTISGELRTRWVVGSSLPIFG